MKGFAIEDFDKLLREPAELNEELAAYLHDGPVGTCLRHPLVYSMVYSPQMNGLFNAQLEGKVAARNEAARERDWSSYVFLHERPWRIDAFTAVCWKMRPKPYWELLGDLYTDTENLWQNKDLWIDLLTADQHGRRWLMDDDERLALKTDFDANIVVYRGYHEGGDPDGLSWTVKPEIAGFFSRRLAPPGATHYVIKGVVRRKDVLAHFTGRNEAEIVALPGTVQVITTELVGVQE